MSDCVQVVRVKSWAESQGAFVEINSTDFDPAVHTLFDLQVPVAADEAQPEPVQKRKRGAK